MNFTQTEGVSQVGSAVSLQALNIERGAHYPSVIQLKGNVEVKTPVCLPVGRHRAVVCDGEMILHADAAEFHEDTGEIKASGSVSVTPLRHRKKPATHN